VSPWETIDLQPSPRRRRRKPEGESLSYASSLEEIDADRVSDEDPGCVWIQALRETGSAISQQVIDRLQEHSESNAINLVNGAIDSWHRDAPLSSLSEILLAAIEGSSNAALGCLAQKTRENRKKKVCHADDVQAVHRKSQGVPRNSVHGKSAAFEAISRLQNMAGQPRICKLQPSAVSQKFHAMVARKKALDEVAYAHAWLSDIESREAWVDPYPMLCIVPGPEESLHLWQNNVDAKILGDAQGSSSAINGRTDDQAQKALNEVNDMSDRAMSIVTEKPKLLEDRCWEYLAARHPGILEHRRQRATLEDAEKNR
jgi:hypothetical protein